jgi:hypothetical protein
MLTTFIASIAIKILHPKVVTVALVTQFLLPCYRNIFGLTKVQIPISTGPTAVCDKMRAIHISQAASPLFFRIFYNGKIKHFQDAVSSPSGGPTYYVRV